MTGADNRENRITCEVVQDLMPSYADGLASEDTAKIIEEHTKECAECREMLENMLSDGQLAQRPDERDRKEIDFLRKSRKKGRSAVALGVILTFLAVAAAIGAKQFLIGSDYHGDMGCDISVSGSTMTVGVTAADSIHVIRGVDFDITDGVARGTARAVLPGLLHSSGVFTQTADEEGGTQSGAVNCDWTGDFSFSEDIREVWIGDRLFWAGGRAVSPMVSELYDSRHTYIGDVSENGRTLDALRMTEDLGSLYSELETDAEPYIWTIVLDEDQTKYRPAYLEKRLNAYGYAMLGTVSNLSEVDFRYTAAGKEVIRKVTAEDASEFLGRDIKECCSDAGALSELMEKAGLE